MHNSGGEYSPTGTVKVDDDSDGDLQLLAKNGQNGGIKRHRVMEQRRNPEREPYHIPEKR
jgi:hypothetical protein